MEHPADNHDALYEAVFFLSHFKDLPDPRQSGKITCPFVLGPIVRSHGKSRTACPGSWT